MKVPIDKLMGFCIFTICDLSILSDVMLRAKIILIEKNSMAESNNLGLT